MAPGGATRRLLQSKQLLWKSEESLQVQLVKMTVVGQTLPQEAYNLRESDQKGVALRCVDRLQQGHGMSRE